MGIKPCCKGSLRICCYDVGTSPISSSKPCIAKKIAQLPAVDMQELSGRFCSYSNHSPKVIQPSFDPQSLCRLHSDCAKIYTYAKTRKILITSNISLPTTGYSFWDLFFLPVHHSPCFPPPMSPSKYQNLHTSLVIKNYNIQVQNLTQRTRIYKLNDYMYKASDFSWWKFITFIYFIFLLSMPQSPGAFTFLLMPANENISNHQIPLLQGLKLQHNQGDVSYYLPPPAKDSLCDSSVTALLILSFFPSSLPLLFTLSKLFLNTHSTHTSTSLDSTTQPPHLLHSQFSLFLSGEILNKASFSFIFLVTLVPFSPSPFSTLHSLFFHTVPPAFSWLNVSCLFILLHLMFLFLMSFLPACWPLFCAIKIYNSQKDGGIWIQEGVGAKRNTVDTRGHERLENFFFLETEIIQNQTQITCALPFLTPFLRPIFFSFLGFPFKTCRVESSCIKITATLDEMHKSITNSTHLN
ncbi:hypothetical protein VP01_3493g2 [Puccinia sorghi]|uniref:Uncharacterized protein n=1 Tax=Puccinia sorghi TaxID=27349 RepID=A0A0L6UXQ3_9BASI|nr:hypothetical protein VP01_3493g2 [Puccinia sorghi]